MGTSAILPGEGEGFLAGLRVSRGLFGVEVDADGGSSSSSVVQFPLQKPDVDVMVERELS